MVSISRSFWLEFIDLYRNLPELWMVESDEYKNQILRNRAYSALLEKYREADPNSKMETVKKKINALRTNYRKELKKKRAGHGQPTLWYFEEMNFLKNQRTPRQSIKKTEDVKEVDVKGVYVDLKEVYLKEETDLNSVSSNSENGREEKCRDDQERKFYTKSFGNFEQTNDEAEIYGRSWAFEYRKLTTKQQLYAKKHIDDILFQARLGELTNTWFPAHNSTPFSVIDEGNFKCESIDHDGI